MDPFVPIPEGFLQVRAEAHTIISYEMAPYDPGEVQIFMTDHNRTPDAKVRIFISRFPEHPFEDYIAKLQPLREEIVKAAHKAGEYFKERLP